MRKLCNLNACKGKTIEDVRMKKDGFYPQYVAFLLSDNSAVLFEISTHGWPIPQTNPDECLGLLSLSGIYTQEESLAAGVRLQQAREDAERDERRQDYEELRKEFDV